jgi:hypothetical protein
MLSVLFVSLFAVVLGLAFCFAGYRVFLILLPVWGFFAGLWLGAEVTTLIFGGGFLATTTGLVIGLVVGLIFAVLSYLFYIIGVALVGAGFGWALGAGFMAAIGLGPGFLATIVAIVVAIIVAGLTLALNLQKYVIIVISAIGGANAVVLSVLLLFGRVSLDTLKEAGNAIAPVLQDSWFWLIAWLIVAIAGIVVQIRANRSYTYSRADQIEDWG